MSVLYSDWSTRVAVFSGTAITHSQGPEIPVVETALADPARPVPVLWEPGPLSTPLKLHHDFQNAM